MRSTDHRRRCNSACRKFTRRSPTSASRILRRCQSALGEVQAAIANIPQPNLQPLQASLADLEAFVVALDKPPQDLGRCFNRLVGAGCGAGARAGRGSRCAGAEADRPPSRGHRGSDRQHAGTGPVPVIGAVRAIDNRHDLVAMENRLTAIEYGLAAVHHMLRSRADAMVQRRTQADGAHRSALQVVRQRRRRNLRRRGRSARPIRSTLSAGRTTRRTCSPSPPLARRTISSDRWRRAHAARRCCTRSASTISGRSPSGRREEIDWVESKLMHFRGRIRRDDWVGHARTLAAAPTAVEAAGAGGDAQEL